MALLSWIILGGLAGWLASMVTGKDGSMGVVANVIVGVVGAFLGGFLWQSVLGGDTDASLADFDLSSFLVAFGGAVLLLLIVKLFQRA